MIPDVLASEQLKKARKMIRSSAIEIQNTTGCNVMAFAADINNELQQASTMAVDKELEERPDKEVALLKGVLTRAMSLLIMHVGKDKAMVMAIKAASYGNQLLRQAENE
jgi:hypothetical protein